ncbi:MAG: hypothetical protein M3N21_00525 [Actinomycetota bacterium]|nr:hypothetical protein [Actinomycetota bacterium]
MNATPGGLPVSAWSWTARTRPGAGYPDEADGAVGRALALGLAEARVDGLAETVGPPVGDGARLAEDVVVGAGADEASPEGEGEADAVALR